MLNIVVSVITWKYVSSSGPQSHFGIGCTGSEQRLQDCNYVATYRAHSNVYLQCQLIQSSKISCFLSVIRYNGNQLCHRKKYCMPKNDLKKICYNNRRKSNIS